MGLKRFERGDVNSRAEGFGLNRWIVRSTGQRERGGTREGALSRDVRVLGIVGRLFQKIEAASTGDERSQSVTNRSE